MTAWRLGLQNVQRRQLDQLLDRLEQVDDPAFAARLMAGPVVQHIYKLQVGGGVRLRPMLCFGPIDISTELTLLCPATERDGQLVPGDAPARAQLLRAEILEHHPHRRRAFDRPHETRWMKKPKSRKKRST
jgi:hypothetical protein